MPAQPDLTILSSRDFSAESVARETFALDVLQGLSAERKFIPSKYFYDARGSELFSQIMDLRDYYLTDCEQEILKHHGAEIARLAKTTCAGEELALVELGAGDGRKTELLLDALAEAQAPFHYVPIDISEQAVRALTDTVVVSRPELSCRGLVAEYFDAFRWLNRNTSARKMVLFLGSNIGNFDTTQGPLFLRTLWNALEEGDLLLTGFDLKKDIGIMLRAYNDSRGVTAEFNRNILRRINRELGANFDEGAFEHYGTYDVFSGAMESYLVSLRDQDVSVDALNKTFSFAPFEPVHLEYSFKFLPEDIDRLAAETGFRVLATIFDSRRFFADTVWQVQKER